MLLERMNYLHECFQTYRSSEVDDEISPHETMFNQWYFEIGGSALDNVAYGFLSSNLQGISSILDIPCGHGRVLRHLAKMFPDTEIHASDLDLDGLDFCRKKGWATQTIVSSPNLMEASFPRQYDLIWIGSLFTHFDRAFIAQWLTHLSKFLTDNGIIVATLHGRWCERVHTVSPYILEDSWKKILEEYHRSGFGYADYNEGESHSYIPGTYGVSIGTPSAYFHEIEAIAGVRILGYKERAWADHQDVLVIGRPAFDEPWPNML